MSSLTAKQTADLNNAILNYLRPLVPTETINLLQKSLNINEITNDNQLLQKKWSAIIKLQKKIIDLETQLNHISSVKLVTHDPTNTAAPTTNNLLKFNWLPSNVRKTLNNSSSITSISVHPSLPVFVSGAIDGTFTVWNLLDLTQPVKQIQAHSKSLNNLAISPDPLDFNDNNHVLVTCGSDLFIKIWDLKTFKLLRTLNGHEHIVSSVVFKDSYHIFSCSRDNSIKLWDLKSGWCLRSFIGHSDWVRCLDIANSEYLLSGSNDQSIRLSHGESGTGLGLMLGHNQVIETVKFVPMGANKLIDKFNQFNIVENDETYNKLGFKYAVSGGRDDMINLWYLPLPILRPHNHPLPSSNPQGQLIKTFKGHKSWVKKLIFHPNNKILISASDDKSIKFWSLESFECLHTLENHNGFVNTIEFASPIYENRDKFHNDEEINENMRCIFLSGGSDSQIKLYE